MLANLRDVARLTQWRTLVDDLRGLPAGTLADFLEAHDQRDPWTSIAGRTKLDATQTRGWPTRRRPGPHADEERDLLRAVRRMLHIDDPERVGSTAMARSSASLRKRDSSTNDIGGCC